ncbi:hypothetical protein Lal_00019545 [Lupinus albus]|nr:hypothetical protein Lal_00019545 [Lupinus albus]
MEGTANLCTTTLQQETILLKITLARGTEWISGVGVFWNEEEQGKALKSVKKVSKLRCLRSLETQFLEKSLLKDEEHTYEKSHDHRPSDRREQDNMYQEIDHCPTLSYSDNGLLMPLWCCLNNTKNNIEAQNQFGTKEPPHPFMR